MNRDQISITGNIMMDAESANWGAGYDSISFEWKNNTALTSESIIPQKAADGAAKITYNAQLCEDYQSLASSISTSAQAAANIFGVEVKGSASLLHDTKMTATSIALVARVSIRSAGEILNKENIQLKPDASTLLKKDPKAFWELYGNYFVDSSVSGGELLIVLLRTLSTYEEKTKAAASVSVKVSPGDEGSAEFSMALNSMMSHSDTKIQLYKVGGDPTLPDSNPKAIMQAVKNFPAEVAKSPATFQVSLAQYESFAGIDGLALKQLLREPQINVTNYASTVEAYQNIEQDIDYLLSNNLGSPGQLQNWKQEVETYQSQLLNLFTQNQGTLKLPSISDYMKEMRMLTPADLMSNLNPLMQGKPVQSGDTVLFTYEDGNYINPEIESYAGRAAAQEYFATLGPQDKAVKLQVIGPNSSGPIESGMLVNIKTTETAVGAYNILSAFSDHDLYYYKPGYGNNQLWKVQKADNSSGPILYGEDLVITNVAWEGYVLQRAGNSEWITCLQGLATHWKLVKA